MTDMETRLEVFSEMLLKMWNVYFWHYDGEGRIIKSTCQDLQILDYLFTTTGSKKRIVDACLLNKKAALAPDYTGFLWIAVPHFINDVFISLYVIGPVFAAEVSDSSITSIIQSIPDLEEIKSRIKIRECLKDLPTIQHTAFCQFGIILQHHINGEVINASDISLIKSEISKSDRSLGSKSSGSEAMGAYAFERKLMKAIETGNIYFKRPPHPPHVGKLSNEDPLRQAKNEMIVFVTITVRTALRGGLPEETAYVLSDQYIQMIENEKDISHVYIHGGECYKDFLHRMYNYRISKGRSREIQNCIAYIETNLNEKIDFEDMSTVCGYSRNYLSTKFKSEMGMSMVDYITAERIDQAKTRLRSTKESITDIADSLKFTSPSYFGSIFHELVGVSPSEYRKGKEEADQ